MHERKPENMKLSLVSRDVAASTTWLEGFPIVYVTGKTSPTWPKGGTSVVRVRLRFTSSAETMGTLVTATNESERRVASSLISWIQRIED